MFPSGRAKQPTWIAPELVGCPWPDQRLHKRAGKLIQAMSHQPDASLPQCCGDAAAAKAAYRFFDHDELNFNGLLAGHLQATWKRVGQRSVDAAPVLLLEDSTTFNFQRHAPTEGLGPLGNVRSTDQGLWLHSTLALSAEGHCLGFVHAHCWARDPDKTGQRHQRHQRAAQDKESHRWVSSLQKIAPQAAEQAPGRKLIRIADREADLWEVLAETRRHLQAGESLHVLTRSRHDRRVEVLRTGTEPANASHTQEQSLWEALKQGHQAERQTLALPGRSARPGKEAAAARQADLEVRYCAVRVQPASRSEPTSQEAVACWAVEAREPQPPEGCEPLHWRLLTTWPVKDGQTAVEVLRWYRLRWQIEVMHKVLKSGLGFEQRGLRTGQRLEAVLALSLIVGWRILGLMHQGRQEATRQELASQVLEPDECEVLQMLRKAGGRKLMREQGLNLQEASEEIARLGGWLGRTRDPPPGVVVLWRGLQTLASQMQGFRLAQQLMGNR